MQSGFQGELFEADRVVIVGQDIEQFHHALDDLDGVFDFRLGRRAHHWAFVTEALRLLYQIVKWRRLSCLLVCLCRDETWIMRVGLFVTCLVDLMRPSIGFSALELLEAAGCEVVVPMTQTCCGQPAFNSGDAILARTLAEKLLAEFEHCDYLVLPSGACAAMVRVHYPELFADMPALQQRMRSLAAKTHELTDFLVNVAHWDAVTGRFDGSVTYHDSCSGLRELGIRAQPRALLSRMAGVTLQEMEGAGECCGFGGVFAARYGELSAAIAERKCACIQATGVDAVVGGDLGCLLNIEGKLRRMGDEQTKVLHIAEMLVARGLD
jgi:L-lactate dehydrogenase complex protein LldE